MMRSGSIKRRPVNLSIRGDILEQAKELELNTSQAAESGIKEAIKQAQEEQWLRNNKDAIAKHNKRVEDTGTLLKPHWISE